MFEWKEVTVATVNKSRKALGVINVTQTGTEDYIRFTRHGDELWIEKFKRYYGEIVQGA